MDPLIQKYRAGYIFPVMILLILLCGPGQGKAEEPFVPNQGSPYMDFASIGLNQILHIPTGLLVSRDQMLDSIEASRVIYIGESHDNVEAHRIQLEVIQNIFARFPGKVAVGMEMFRRSAQSDLDLWVEGELSDKKFKRLFRKNWGSGFKLYQPIFEFIKENRLPLIGLKSSRETETRLRKGYTQVNFPEMDENDVYHRAYAEAIFGGGKENHGQTDGLYKMLVLWEESMAETVAEFLNNPDYSNWKLIALAGGFHVQYGYGIPKRAFRRIPHAYSILLPVVTDVPEELKDRVMKIKPVSIPLYAADFGWKISYKVLPQNRIRLGIRVKDDSGKGVRVVSVAKNSTAEKMKIAKDDLLLELDGETLSGVEDLVDLLQTKDFGDPVNLLLRRADQEINLQGIIEKQ